MYCIAENAFGVGDEAVAGTPKSSRPNYLGPMTPHTEATFWQGLLGRLGLLSSGREGLMATKIPSTRASDGIELEIVVNLITSISPTV